jgi:glycerol-3-phosphate acyltransferase PlsX
MPALAPMYSRFDPENTGGAMLLGVDGVCIISHGSSSAHAVTRAIEVAHEMHSKGAVGNLKAALT